LSGVVVVRHNVDSVVLEFKSVVFGLRCLSIEKLSLEYVSEEVSDREEGSVSEAESSALL
jgi:hypothetical protein